MKKIMRCFSILLFSVALLFVFSNNVASAAYDRDKNTVSVSVTKEEITITVRYQRGFDVNTADYFWYDVQGIEWGATKGEEIKINYVENSTTTERNFIASGDASYHDSHITSVTFKVDKDNDTVLKELSQRTDGDKSTKYTLFVRANFCALRQGEEPEFSACQYYDDPVIAKVEIDLNDVKNDYNISIDTSGIENEELRGLMDKIVEIVNDYVLPCIWALLGIFFVIKGSLLGFQIVKSADEPQVRQEKVGALKWLVIGVAIAYGASGVVRALTAFFSGEFK